MNKNVYISVSEVDRINYFKSAGSKKREPFPGSMFWSAFSDIQKEKENIFKC